MKTFLHAGGSNFQKMPTAFEKLLWKMLELKDSVNMTRWIDNMNQYLSPNLQKTLFDIREDADITSFIVNLELAWNERIS